MFDKDGKLDERSQRILGEQTIPPRYGQSPGMQARANMTATEVLAAEKAWAKQASERHADTLAQAFGPMIDEMLRIAQQQNYGIDPSKAMLIDDEGKLSIVDVTIDADQSPARPE